MLRTTVCWVWGIQGTPADTAGNKLSPNIGWKEKGMQIQ